MTLIARAISMTCLNLLGRADEMACRISGPSGDGAPAGGAPISQAATLDHSAPTGENLPVPLSAGDEVNSSVYARISPIDHGSPTRRFLPDEDLRGGETAIEIPPAGERPPIIEKTLDGPPVRHPSDDDEALLDEAAERP
jgi:hypothetical protein